MYKKFTSPIFCSNTFLPIAHLSRCKLWHNCNPANDIWFDILCNITMRKISLNPAKQSGIWFDIVQFYNEILIT